MNTGKGKNNFRIAVKTALLEREKTVTDLARAIKRNRNSVYRAINYREFPRIKQQIREELGLNE